MAEMLGIVLFMIAFGVMLALNVPEAPSEGAICGAERDAPTPEGGCAP